MAKRQSQDSFDITRRFPSWKIRLPVWLGVTAGVAALLVHFVGLERVSPWRFTLAGSQWEMAQPVWLWLVVLAPLLYLIQGFSLSDRSRWGQALSLGLRALLLVGVALALTRPRQVVKKAKRVCTVFLVDVSDSVSAAQIREAHRVIQTAWKRRAKHEVKVVTFARRPRKVDIPKGAKKIPALKRHGRGQGAGSNVEAALQLAHGLYPPGTVRRAVVFSDGIQTRGDLVSGAVRLGERGIRLYHRFFTADPRDEVLIRDVALPKKVDVGKPFKLQVNVFSNHTTRATFSLKYGVSPNEMYWNERERKKTVTLHPGHNPVVFTAEVHSPGLTAWVVNMKLPKGTAGVRDHVKENNRAVAILTVKDKPRVLLVEGHGAHRVAPFQRLMAQEKIKVEIRSPWGLPTSVWGLKKYDCVIFSDVREGQVGLQKRIAVARYVRSHGGCFIMAGGDDSFGSGGWGRTRIERLLPVRMESPKERRKPSVALVLVLDKSGSMGTMKMELAKEAAIAAAKLLSSSDLIGVVAHDHSAYPVVELTRAANRLRIMESIRRIHAGGGTNIRPALDIAHGWLKRASAKIKHVIVLSDGVSDEKERCLGIADTMRGNRITLSTVGVGAGADVSFLQRLARNGGGRSYFTADPNNVPKIFTKETKMASRASIVEEAVKAVTKKTAAFLRGVPIARAPLLRGYNPTTAKAGADVFLITHPYGEPLLARWRRGLGKTAAFTSDIKGRWATAWFTAWMGGMKKLWAQLLRDTMRLRTWTSYPMWTHVRDGRVHVVVDAVDRQDNFQNGLESVVTVTDWWAPGRKRKVRLHQTAAGRYEATFALHRYGAFVLQADHYRRTRSGRVRMARSFGAVTLAYPREYLQLQPPARECRRDPSACPGRHRLRFASAVTGGRALGHTNVAVAKLFDAGRDRAERFRERWPLIVLLLLGLLLLDLFVRRSQVFI